MAQRRVMNVADVVPFSLPGWEGKFESRLLVDRDALGSEKLTVNHFTLKVGQKTPLGSHGAPYDEVYYVLGGEAVLNLDGVDYDLERDMLVFIPAGTSHGLTNKSQTEDFTILTIWPRAPEPGANGVYDARKEAWGTTYREISE